MLGPKSRVRLALSIAIVPVSLIALAWGIWPLPRQMASLEVQPSAMVLSTDPPLVPEGLSTPDLGRFAGGSSALDPTSSSLPWDGLQIAPAGTLGARLTPAPASSIAAIPEVRRLSLAYPALMRAGDSDVVRLSLAVDAPGDVTATALGNATTVQAVGKPDLYETHNVIAEARLDVPGLDIRPSESVSEPLLPGRAVSFFWSVHATEAGTYDGTAWLFLTVVDKATGAHSRNAVSAQSVDIPAKNLFGLRGDTARRLGGIGFLAGGVLGFPFVEGILRLAWLRIRRTS